MKHRYTILIEGKQDQPDLLNAGCRPNNSGQMVYDDACTLDQAVALCQMFFLHAKKVLLFSGRDFSKPLAKWGESQPQADFIPAETKVLYHRPFSNEWVIE